MPSKGSTSARGYGAKHQALRKRYEPLVASGHALCRRCSQPIQPDAPWDLGHDDNDRTIPPTPEHRGNECPLGGNRGTRRRQAQATQPHGVDTSRTW